MYTDYGIGRKIQGEYAFLLAHKGDVLSWVFTSPLTLVATISVAIILLLCVDWYFKNTVNAYFSYNINTNREERRQLRGTNQTITKPNRGDFAYQMGLGIQEFGKGFNSIRHATPAEKKREYTYAREILNTILEHEIPKANLVFKEATQIREKVQSLNRTFNVFGSRLTLSLKKGFRKFYQHPEMDSFLWGSLENDWSLSSEINSLIDELIVLLNQEGVENE